MSKFKLLLLTQIRLKRGKIEKKNWILIINTNVWLAIGYGMKSNKDEKKVMQSQWIRNPITLNAKRNDVFQWRIQTNLNGNQPQLKSVYSLQFAIFGLQNNINFVQFYLLNGPLFEYWPHQLFNFNYQSSAYI